MVINQANQVNANAITPSVVALANSVIAKAQASAKAANADVLALAA